MKEVRVLEIKESVFADNDRQADNLRRELKEQGVFLMNLMSSPGSGKTTTLKGTIEQLKDRLRIGVMEADIDSDVDAKAIAETGVKSIQLHTGGMCHLDAEMTRQGVEGLGVADVDLAILENVGNLVCPAEFDTGASKNVMILSVPEGHDKPLKYPLMFQICDAVLINKIDVLPYFDFDMERVKEYIEQIQEEIDSDYGGRYRANKNKHYKEDSIRAQRDKKERMLDSLQSTVYVGKSSVSYNIKGRYKTYLPIPVYKCEFGGKIVVAVVVNRQGRVVKAEVVDTESDKDDALREVAVDVALKSEFNADEKAPERQAGTITYNFVKQ